MAETTQDGGNAGATGAGAGATGAQGGAGGTGGAGAAKTDAGAGGNTALTAPAKDATAGTGGTTTGAEPAKTGQNAPAEIALKLPDGFKAGPEVEEFRGWAKGAGLKTEQAQKVFDLYLKSQQDQLAAIAEQQVQQQKEWNEALPKDKEFGGAQYEANRIIAQKAMAQFGSPELVKFLNEWGLTNHPELVRAFYRAGKALGEDSPSSTGKGASAGGDDSDPKAALRSMYSQSPELFGEPRLEKPQQPQK